MKRDRTELILEAKSLLDSPAPRKIRLSGLTEAPGFWLRAVLMLVIFSFLYSLFGVLRLAPILASQCGTSSQGKVIERSVSHGRHGPTYSLQVQFQNGTRTEVGTIDVSRQTFEGVDLHSMVGIHFLSLLPFRPALDSEPPFNFGDFFLLFLFSSFGYGVYWVMKARYLLINGKRVTGKVLSTSSKTCYVQYEFEGQKYPVSMPLYYYGWNNQGGDEVLVLIDPFKPKKSLVYDPAKFLFRPTDEKGEILSKLVS